eukprot:6191188-Pleurochrysis_carterae.AAC.2
MHAHPRTLARARPSACTHARSFAHARTRRLAQRVRRLAQRVRRLAQRVRRAHAHSARGACARTQSDTRAQNA